MIVRWILRRYGFTFTMSLSPASKGSQMLGVKGWSFSGKVAVAPLVSTACNITILSVAKSSCIEHTVLHHSAPPP